jgi:hypothetical protein
LPKKIEFDLLLADLALQFGNAPANGTRHHSRSLRRTLGRRETHRLASAWPTAATQRLSPTGSVTIPPNVEVLAQNLRFLRYHAPHCPDAWWHLHLLRAGQGQGWQRNIVMSGSPHLPSDIRQWFGDSRGHWEGETLVIDVTNFGPKTDFQGARELASGGAMDSNRTDLARLLGDRRGHDGVDTAMDRQTGLHQAERPREQSLLRAAVPGGKLWASRPAAWTALGRACFCGETRS